MTYDAREKSGYGGAPVELYRFICGARTWAYTSADVAQSHLGLSFVPEAIARGEIDASDEDSQGVLEITVPRTNEVAALFLPDLPPSPVLLEIYRLHRGDAEVVLFWSGEIGSAEFAGSRVRLAGAPVSRVLRKQLPPNSFQAQCNWALFSTQCGLDRFAYRQAATITAISGYTITAAAFGTHPDGYFRAGWVEIASGEKHWVTEHVGSVLTLMTPFRSLVVGDAVDAYPGCDRTIAACKAYSNLARYLGFPFVPTKNPFTTGVA